MKNFVRACKAVFLSSAVCLLFVSPERSLAADSFAEGAHELAGRILSSTGPLDKAELTFTSLASLGTQEIADAREAIESEMRARGVQIVAEPPAAAGIHVTLSENYLGYIWIAEIRRDRKHDVVMTTQERRADASFDTAVRMTIQPELIYEQDDPVLDLMFREEELLILSPDRLALYRRRNGQWVPGDSAPLNSVLPMPRDVRGRLVDDGDTLRVLLPGLVCSGKAIPALSLECSQRETDWQLAIGDAALAPGRNYFLKDKMPPFFSASVVNGDGTKLWAVTGIDGRGYLYDGALKQVGTLEGLGSEIASADSRCGSGRQLFAALKTDPPERGAIQAFEIVNGQAVSVSALVEFPGPVTALWPVSNRNGVAAVSRDRKTGRYEAFYLSISCSH